MTSSIAMMSAEQAKQLKCGREIILQCATVGCDENDIERRFPAGSVAVVSSFETLPPPQGFAVHVSISDTHSTIVNTFDEFDFDGSFPFEMIDRTPIGYQIGNAQGDNIQGDDEDPSGHTSFEILSEEIARRVVDQHPETLTLLPIYEGDIEEPTFVL